MRNHSVSFLHLCQCLSACDPISDFNHRPAEPGNYEPDWYEIVKLADIHFVLPLLYYQLERNKRIKALPGDLQHLLSDVFHLNRERSRLIRNEIARIASILNPAGIEPLFLKGAAALLMEIFEDDGLRIMNDVDFLVRKDEQKRCMQLMTAEGYYPMATDDMPEDFFESHYHGRPLVHDRHNIRFEIHHRLGPTHIVNTEECFAESAVVNTAGGVVRVPGKSHFILHNILHHQVFNHGLDKDDTPLYQLMDLHAMRKCHDPEIDWARIQRFFHHPSIYDAFYYSFDLSRRYFGDRPPVPIPLLLPLRIRYRWLRVKMNNYLQFRRDRHTQSDS